METLSGIRKKIADGQRLSDEDALALFHCHDLAEIGRLADEVNRHKNGESVYFNINRHINPTNICALSCKFCAYSRKPGEEGAYAYSIEEMVTKAGEAVRQGATEVHMVGGLHPRWRFDHYKDMIAAVKSAYPELHIKAFTAVELDWLARKARKSVAEVLMELREVGLGSLPGGGAEIFHPEIRERICDTKVSAEQWIDTHRTAHRLGMHSNCTMLYGHIESYEHRVDHMRRLRELQDETGGFNAFIPLSFQPFQNEMGIDRYTFGYDDLKTLAIARLYLDNFKHVKAYWIMLGQDIAQLALHFGANDLDGTVIEEKISRMAGGRAGMAMHRSHLERIIYKAKRQPVERDTLYAPVIRPDAPRPEVHYEGFDPEVARTALTRVENAETPESVAMEDLLQIATRAPLADLARVASQRQAERGFIGCFSPTLEIPLKADMRPAEITGRVETAMASSLERHGLAPSTLALSLPALNATDDTNDIDMEFLVAVLWALKHRFPESELSLRGLKHLWRLAQNEGVSIRAFLSSLQEAGLSVIESAPRETEADLTHSEVLELHQSVHAAGLATLGKVELSASATGTGEPHWEPYLRRIIALSAETAPGLLGIAVEASPGSFVTPAEYMRALAMARLAAREETPIIAPFGSMPTMSPVQGLGTAYYQHPAEKIAPLALHYGASDLGAIDVEHMNPRAVAMQIRAAGFRPMLRDARFRRPPISNGSHWDFGDIRHVPEAAWAEA